MRVTSLMKESITGADEAGQQGGVRPGRGRVPGQKHRRAPEERKGTGRLTPAMAGVNRPVPFARCGMGRFMESFTLLLEFVPLSQVTAFRARTATISPYPPPPTTSGVECSMSMLGPSLLVHRPLGNCRAACVGVSSRANSAVFSTPGSRSVPAHGL